MERSNAKEDALNDSTRGQTRRKTIHEGNEGTVGFWIYMKALYKEEE